MYRVLLERGAEKDLARLSSEIHDRVIAAIQALANNPRPPGCRKLAGSKNDWRIRVATTRGLRNCRRDSRRARQPRTASPRSLSLMSGGNWRRPACVCYSKIQLSL
jgi:mRNA interferase RelE/StbE